MKAGLILGMSLLALAGCKEQAPSVDAENKDRAQGKAETAADPNALVAGQWETKQRIQSADTRGMDARGKADLLGSQVSLDQCLPPEESKRPDANFFAGGDGSECQYTKFAMRDGKLNATMTCNASPGSISLSLNGTYTPTSYALDASATRSGGEAASATTTAKLSGTWLGPCPNENSQRAPKE